MTIFTVTGESELIERMLEVLRAEADATDDASLQFGEPIPLDSEDDALDSPIGIEDVKAIAECVTVVATSGTALAIFIERVVKLVKGIGKPAQIMNEDGEELIVAPDSDVEKVKRALLGSD